MTADVSARGSVVNGFPVCASEIGTVHSLAEFEFMSGIAPHASSVDIDARHTCPGLPFYVQAGLPTV